MEISVARRRPVMVLAVAAMLVMTAALPAAAAVCQAAYTIDCTVPPTGSCTANISTKKTTSIPGLGSLELRYDLGCRSIWGRAPQAVGQNVSVTRLTCQDPPTAGNTEGLTVTLGSGKVWSRQLNDADCTGRAKAIYGGNVYLTGSY